MTSVLVHLSQIPTELDEVNNSLHFLYFEQPAVLSLVTLNEESCYFTLYFYGCNFSTPKIRSVDLLEHYSKDSNVQNIKLLNNTVDISIELNPLGCPADIRLYTRPTDPNVVPKLLMIIYLEWIRPEQIK